MTYNSKIFFCATLTLTDRLFVSVVSMCSYYCLQFGTIRWL